MSCQQDEDMFSDEDLDVQEIIREHHLDYWLDERNKKRMEHYFEQWKSPTSNNRFKGMKDLAETYKYTRLMPIDSMKTLLTPFNDPDIDYATFVTYDDLRRSEFEESLIKVGIRENPCYIEQVVRKVTTEITDPLKLRRVLFDSPDLLHDDAHADIMEYILIAEAHDGKVKVSWATQICYDEDRDTNATLFPISPSMLKLSERFRNRVLAFNDKKMFYEYDKMFSTTTYFKIMNMYSPNIVKGKSPPNLQIANGRDGRSIVPEVPFQANMILHYYYEKQLLKGFEVDGILHPDGLENPRSNRELEPRLPYVLSMQYREEYDITGNHHELKQHYNNMKSLEQATIQEPFITQILKNDGEFYQRECSYLRDITGMLKEFHCRDYINRFYAKLGCQMVKIIYDNNHRVKDVEIITECDFKKSHQEKVAFSWKDAQDSVKNRQSIASFYSCSQYKRFYYGIGFYPTHLPTGYLNLFTGLEILPLEPETEAVLDGLNLINDHMLEILCNGVREYYEYAMDWLASRFQREFMNKMIVVLAFYSEQKQIGKGAYFDAKPKGFLPKVLGKYYLKSLQPLNSDIGLLGKYNRGHENKLVIYLDENGEFTHAVKGNLQLESFLSASQIQVAAKGVNPVTIQDGCGIIMTSNNKMFARADPSGSKLFAVQCSDKYSKHYAEKGIDGMTLQIREDYFNKLGKAMDNELVQRAYIHQMQTRDLSKYRTTPGVASAAWQSYPQTNLLKEMCCHSKCLVLDFIETWRDHRVFVTVGSLPVKLETDLWYRPQEDKIWEEPGHEDLLLIEHGHSMWNIFKKWTNINNRQVDQNRSCKDKATFQDTFQKYTKSKIDKMFTSKAKSKKKLMYYKLIEEEHEEDETHDNIRERAANAAYERQRATTEEVELTNRGQTI